MSGRLMAAITRERQRRSKRLTAPLTKSVTIHGYIINSQKDRLSTIQASAKALLKSFESYGLIIYVDGCVITILQQSAIYVLYRDDNALNLPYCIAIAGFVCALFAFGIPQLSALRIWLGVPTFLVLIFIIIAFIFSLKDGTNPIVTFGYKT